MKRFIHFLSLLFVASFIFSCQEPNPEEVYGATYKDFPGPRYLFKTEYNNLAQEDYNAVSGLVTSSHQYKYQGYQEKSRKTFTMGYSGGSLSAFEFTESSAGTSVTMTYKYQLSYDAKGQLASYVKKGYEGAVLKSHAEGSVSYDPFGRISQISERIAGPAMPYVYYASFDAFLVFDGANISKVNNVKKTYDPVSGALTSSVTDTYNYKAFDQMKNPYTTFPTALNILLGTLNQAKIVNLSPNNPMSEEYFTPSLTAPKVTTFVYEYDKQFYAISNGVENFLYKALK